MTAGSTHPHIQTLIRVTALIRSSTLPILDLEAFRKQVSLEAMGVRSLKSEPCFDFVRLNQQINRAILSSILATAQRIEHLTQICLKYYLARFKRIRPLYPVDEKAHLSGFRPWERQPELRSYPTVAIAQPFAVEIQRVSRAFWRLHFISDLRKAASSSRVDWSPADIARLND
jgi:hypothetical protein